MDKVINACSMFNLIGCPLLLACMCVERYLAVIKPVLYLRLRKWEYRMAITAAMWAITLAFCVVTCECSQVESSEHTASSRSLIAEFRVCNE
ncbi:putative P2Y purinoceptor 6-like [Scophthalmus maximus]|uniref:Putative P2Y purinoceptor 6-like n=1 Tax=Scophthalmus maximus TaxID=52904 RepID=A0A2U9B1G3_SCOMX|nr:putative P2Y purinoceptor 6-like [Scophthalmus maximus]